MASPPVLAPEPAQAPLATWSPELRRALEERARTAGFDLVGLASVGLPDDPAEKADAARFAAWIAADHAGEMEYLKRRDPSGALVRSQPHLSLPWARSVVVCALNYRSDTPRSIDSAPADSAWIARYAWSGRAAEDGSTHPTDYHDELLARLLQIEAALQSVTPFTTRCYVDTGPLLERGLAARAGIGWIGKNTCVLNQQLGSWLLLGVIVTSLCLPTSEGPAATRRTASRHRPLRHLHPLHRCLPHQALLGSPLIPPRRARWTPPAASPTSPSRRRAASPPNLRARIGRKVFGCDICQEVCPWNARASRTSLPGHAEGTAPRPELINPALAWLASLDSREFKRHFKGSPLERTGRKRLLRNVAIAMGNSGIRQAFSRNWKPGTSPQPAPPHPARRQTTPSSAMPPSGLASRSAATPPPEPRRPPARLLASSHAEPKGPRPASTTPRVPP